ncbi:MAG TPA: hypothetical protein VG052_09490 [Puia sp.]|nr:hypothetical protein [Puia sp.]
MTTFTGLAGGAGFFGSGLTATGGGGGGGAATGLMAVTGTACLMAGAWIGWDLPAGCVFDTMPETEFGFPPSWTFAGTACALGVLDILDIGAFFAGMDTGFLAGAWGATFLATGLAILLAAGAFFAVLLLPDEWAGFAAAFLAGAIFLTLTAFLAAGLAAFFLVAIQLGFFCDKHL